MFSPVERRACGAAPTGAGAPMCAGTRSFGMELVTADVAHARSQTDVVAARHTSVIGNFVQTLLRLSRVPRWAYAAGRKGSIANQEDRLFGLVRYLLRGRRRN